MSSSGRARGDAGDRRAGVVLAGGRSTRFGERDKAFAELGGAPLVARVVSRLGRAVDGVLVSCRGDQVDRLRRTLRGRGDVCTVEDPVSDRGPTAGVAAGLRACRTEYAAVVACDNPLVDPDVVARLFDRAAGRSGAVPRVGGRLRPTQAVYRTAAMRRCCEAALGADGSLMAAIDLLDPVIVPEDDAVRGAGGRSFADVNTPEDLARARDAARR